MRLYGKQISRSYFRNNGESNYFFAVKENDLQIESGKLTVVVGRSGSGKSTLLNMMAGLLEPSSGKVFLDDTDLYALEDEKRSRFRNLHLGIIPQGQSGLMSLNVKENVLLPCRMYEEEVKEEDALTLLKDVGIDALADAYPNELSGGELRRMAIARALIRHPDFLLCDEPTSDLDDENTIAVLELLKRYSRNNTGILLVTHESEALNYADEVYRMNDGILRREK